MKPEKHIFLLWEKARDKEHKIIKDIQEKFKVLSAFRINWSNKNFSKNLSRFYGEHLPQGCHKHLHVGDGEMSLYIVEDLKPIYKDRKTSKGFEKVNINIFDNKQLYRNWTGGGHKIHASNSIKEARSDILLLTGEFYDDIDNNKWNQKYININELTGNHSWKSIREVFEILNNRIDYVVLRNFECLPNNYYLDKHGDIDLLVKNIDETVSLLNAVKVYKERYRVHYIVNINNEKIYFDFRYVDDKYYCRNWELDILKNYNIYNNIRIPNNSNYKYSLLYHALIHKPEISEDYVEKLYNIFKIKNKLELFSELKRYLLKNKYHITDPIDLSVYFNLEYSSNINLRRCIYYNHITKGQFFNWNQSLKNKKINSELNNKVILKNLNIYNKKILFQNMGIGLSQFASVINNSDISVYEKDLKTCDVLVYLKNINKLYCGDFLINQTEYQKYDYIFIKIKDKKDLLNIIINTDIKNMNYKLYLLVNRDIIENMQNETNFKFNIMYLCNYDEYGFNILIHNHDQLANSSLGKNCHYYIANLSDREITKNKNSVWFSSKDRNQIFRTESTKVNGSIIKRGTKIDNDKILFDPNYKNDFYNSECLETKLCRSRGLKNFITNFNYYYSRIDYICRIKQNLKDITFNDYLIDGKLIDAILKNIIQKEEDYILFDTEWNLKFPIPLSYLKYRALLSVKCNHNLSDTLKNIQFNKLFSMISGNIKTSYLLKYYTHNETSFQNFVKTGDEKELLKIKFTYE